MDRGAEHALRLRGRDLRLGRRSRRQSLLLTEPASRREHRPRPLARVPRRACRACRDRSHQGRIGGVLFFEISRYGFGSAEAGGAG